MAFQKQLCDGDPEFDNEIMRELAHKHGFKWNPSSPEMPNSNGMAESTVKQIKYIIRKCNNENDPWLAILEYTNTPSKSTGMSPAQRFFGRQLRSVLLTMKKFLSPFNAEETKTKIRKAKQHQKKHYDKNAHSLTKLRKGDQVTVLPYGKNQYWKKATLNTGDTWSNLKMEKRLVRNRRHLRLITRPKDSNKTETNRKLYITTKGSEENIK